MELDSGISLAKDIAAGLDNVKDTHVIFCPPFPLLSPVSSAIKGTEIELGAQNLYWEEKGAFTGEVSAAMLLSVGCKFVIIGHSERRQYFGETDKSINNKIKRALKSGLRPILCIGETLDQRQTNRTKETVRAQLQGDLDGLNSEDVKACIIAYEPVWAIGTGQTATLEQAVEVHEYIRMMLRQWFDDALAQSIIIQYGGSVNEGNANELLSHIEIDGALVGGASLKAKSFKQIIMAAEH